MDNFKTATEFVAHDNYLKRRELIKLQIEKQIMHLVREIVNEKLAKIEPVIEEMEAIDKMRQESRSGEASK